MDGVEGDELEVGHVGQQADRRVHRDVAQGDGERLLRLVLDARVQGDGGPRPFGGLLQDLTERPLVVLGLDQRQAECRRQAAAVVHDTPLPPRFGDEPLGRGDLEVSRPEQQDAVDLRHHFAEENFQLDPPQAREFDLLVLRLLDHQVRLERLCIDHDGEAVCLLKECHGFPQGHGVQLRLAQDGQLVPQLVDRRRGSLFLRLGGRLLLLGLTGQSEESQGQHQSECEADRVHTASP